MPDKMPWGDIAIFTAKVTAVVGVVVFLGATGVCAAEIHRIRIEQEEAKRPRWTDKNRWE